MEKAANRKRRDAAVTRSAILAAAHQRFLSENYESAGLRDIAGDAGVDVALIGRYFGGKEGLFRAVISNGARPDLFREPKSAADLPAFLTRLVVEDEDLEHRMEMFIIMLRSASSRQTCDIVREVLQDNVLDPLVEVIGKDGGKLRAAMLLAILMGIGVLRTNMMFDAILANANDRAEYAEHVRGLFVAAVNC